MLFGEIRNGARSLFRVPIVTAISILTVGAGAALFRVVKAVLLNPLPYTDAGRLAWLAEINDAGNRTQVAWCLCR